jgi:translation initiation factor IF-3
MYDKKKTEQEKKKKTKSKEQKELKFGYTIWDNDLDMKTRKATEFLYDWHTVRISVVLRWREKVYKHLALEKLQRVEQALDPVSKSQGVKEEQNWYSLFLFPKKH